MNKTYRLIWNRRTNNWVVVSEVSKARGKRVTGCVASPGRFALSALAFALASVGLAHAAPPLPTELPSAGKVVAGTAGISQAGAAMNISQTSARAAIDWQTFNVGSAATVNIQQPSASSVTLNRVLDSHPSQIFGRINAPGQVFLTNPSGVYFAPGSSVDVGALVATTHSISNADFMAGKYVFNRNGATGSVVNEGALTAGLGGYIALLAPEVRNKGVVVANMGTVALAAGEAYDLQFEGNNTLANIRVTPATIKTLVENGHAVRAPGGLIILSALAVDQVQGGVVNNSGALEAVGLVSHGGVIRLSASGSITHTGSITADAAPGSSGNGGTVTLIADLANPNSKTVVAGSLSARGGERGGNGGFIETSASQVTIEDQASVTTAAAAGLAGTWLIDPVDFNIASSGGNMTGADLSRALGTGNVTIASTTGTSGTAGDVNVYDAVSWNANILKLKAQNDININANLNGLGSAKLALEYGQGAVASGNTDTYRVRPGIQVNLPAGTAAAANFSTKLGSNGTTTNFAVITSLGVAGSTTQSDLQGMSGGLAGKYVLGADINASGTSSWNANAGFLPIGTSSSPFNGTFDGLGHTISGLTIKRPTTTSVGLFASLSSAAVVRNVGLVGGSVTGADSVGALVGANEGTVSNSYATGVVTGSTNVGGLVGNNTGAVNTSYYALAKVTGSNNVGGLVGQNGGTLSNTYSTGVVYRAGSNNTGPFGGLVGLNNGTVNTSYATGVVTTGNSATKGGLIGSGVGPVTGSFWDTESSKLATSAGGNGAKGMSTAQMQTQATFTISDWDFSAAWIMNDGSTYPVLRALTKVLEVTANDALMTYNGSKYSGGNGVTYIGFLNGDTTVANAARDLTYGGTSQDALNAGSSYSIRPGGLTCGSYFCYYRDGELTITQKTVSLSAIKVYDGNTNLTGSQVTITTGVGRETLGFSNATANDKNVAAASKFIATITLEDGANGGLASNYRLPTLDHDNAPVTISAKTVTLSGAKVYDGTTGLTGSQVTIGTGVIVDGVSETLTHSGATANDAHVATANKFINAITLGNASDSSGGLATNYVLPTLNAANAAVVISTKTLTPTLSNTGVSKVYDGTTTAPAGFTPSYSFTGLIAGDTAASLGNTGSTYDSKNVTAASKVTVSGLSISAVTGSNSSAASDYALDTTSKDVTAAAITAKTVTMTGLTASNKIYDGTTSVAISNWGSVSTGVVGTGGLDETLTLNSGTASFIDKNASTGKTVTATGYSHADGANGGLASNYVLSSTTASTTADIAAKTLSVSGLSASNKVYDANTTATLGGSAAVTALAGDVVTLGGSASGAFASKNVGTQAITVSGNTISGADAANYTLVQQAGLSAEIHAKPVMLAAVKTYDGSANLDGSVTVSTGIGGETLTYASATVSNTNVAAPDKFINAIKLADGTGGLASNYRLPTLDHANAPVSILAKPVTLAASKTYDGSTSLSGAV
ncbi:MAG: YDG domain-containing protein, partial [Burkholderiaceae bacterium]